jgi:hypothetical protein
MYQHVGRIRRLGTKCYAFIRKNDGSEDTFVHQNECPSKVIGPCSFAALRNRSSCSDVMYEIRVRTCLDRCFGIRTTFLTKDGVMGFSYCCNDRIVMLYYQ